MIVVVLVAMALAIALVTVALGRARLPATWSIAVLVVACSPAIVLAVVAQGASSPGPRSATGDDAGEPAAQVPTTLEHSVFAVSARGCGQIARGSGFAIGDSSVVTGAHVVAGADRVTISGSDGRDRDATVVAFDPARDTALLHVTGLDARMVRYGNPPSAGDAVAVVGYLEGSSAHAIPASVIEVVSALGVDIYDDAEVRRELLVLDTSLTQGQSGGPVVDADDRVVGMAIAVSTEDPEIGYALTTTELPMPPPAPLPGPVDTGGCLDVRGVRDRA